MVMGREDGAPWDDGLKDSEVAALCRYKLTVSVINESEQAALFLREIGVHRS